MLLLTQVDERIGLTRAAALAFGDDRRSASVQQGATPAHAAALRGVLMQQFSDSHASPPRELVLDVDASALAAASGAVSQVIGLQKTARLQQEVELAEPARADQYAARQTKQPSNPGASSRDWCTARWAPTRAACGCSWPAPTP